jgi:cyanate permease
MIGQETTPVSRSAKRVPAFFVSFVCFVVNNYVMQNSKRETNYRWYILTLAALTHTSASAMPVMCLPVLFKEITADLHLSLVQVGVIWGIGSLPGIVTSLIGGTIGDRFGTRRTLRIVCLLAGIAGTLRGFSKDFLTLGATVFLFGMLTAIIPMNVHKTCGIWFAKRQLGLANGVVSMGMALGFMVTSMVSATVLSPWLGGWRNVLLFYGTLSIAVSVLWHFTRPAPDSAEAAAGETDARSLRQTVYHVVRVRNVWLLGFALLGIGSCIQGMLGYLPLYLRGIGWTAAAADGALATFHGMSMLFVIPLALWSDKLGSRKKVLMGAALLIITGIGLLSIVDGIIIWVAVIMAGFVRDGFMAIFMTMIIETEGVGTAYAGTAIGLVMSLLAVGNLLAPPLGNSLTAVAPGFPFLFWGILATAGFFSLYLAKE